MMDNTTRVPRVTTTLKFNARDDIFEMTFNVIQVLDKT